MRSPSKWAVVPRYYVSALMVVWGHFLGPMHASFARYRRWAEEGLRVDEGHGTCVQSSLVQPPRPRKLLLSRTAICAGFGDAAGGGSERAGQVRRRVPVAAR
eukprot:354260-Chlamydomonas_euryale.AAC.3